MSPADSRTAFLCAECRRDWEAVKAHLSRARATDPSRGEAQAALVALSLDHAYQAFETILVRLELRHAYVVKLDSDKLAANVDRLERVVATTDRWLDAVLTGLCRTT